ncbi:hypothetical protein Srufu_079390 (plasmid) [Streptomyces libani subsp. rufus]|nr:hypothetical protein Srufu_079390 [Streptomyces libani subsp. rufus]
MTEQRAPAVRRLEALVERVAPRDSERWEARPSLKRGRQVSASRARQLRSTVSQLGLAVGHEGMPEGCGRSVKRLLSPQAVDVFLDLAGEGVFRSPQRPDLMGKPLSWPSRAALRDCLKILGEEAGVAVVLPRVARESGAEPVTERQAAVVYRKLADWAAQAPADAQSARALAVVGVILDTGMQTAGMVSRTVGDVELEPGLIRAVYHTQNAEHLPVVEAVLPLRPGTVTAIRQWLVFREELVTGLEGSDHGALWVTLSPTAAGFGADGLPLTYEAGMPLKQWGFRAAHVRAMGRLNAALAGQWDPSAWGSWVPLPTTPEALRRAVDVEALVPELAELRGRFEGLDEEPVVRWADGPHPGVPSFAVHGRESTYTNYRCRCKACYLEMSRKNAARRAARGG